MTTSEKINIAFAIDAKYTPHLEALLKSICYYNKHVNFYVLHNDIPTEWFEGIRCKLEKMGHNLFLFIFLTIFLKIIRRWNIFLRRVVIIVL